MLRMMVIIGITVQKLHNCSTEIIACAQQLTAVHTYCHLWDDTYKEWNWQAFQMYCTPHYSFSQMLEHILRTKWLAALAHLLCRFTLGDTVINLNLGTVQKFGLESLFFFKTDKLTHRRFCKVMHMCHTMVTTGSKNCTQSCHKCYCLHITTQNYSQLLQVLRWHLHTARLATDMPFICRLPLITVNLTSFKTEAWL